MRASIGEVFGAAAATGLTFSCLLSCGGAGTNDDAGAGGVPTGSGAVAGSSGSGGASPSDGGTSAGGSAGAGASDSGGATGTGGGTGTGGAAGTGGDSGTGGGSPGADLSGPAPTNDPDFVVSVSNYEFGQPKLTVWRRYKDAVANKATTCTSELDGGCAVFTCDLSAGGFEGIPDPNGQGQDFVDGGTVRASFQKDGVDFLAEVTTDETESVHSDFFQPADVVLLDGEVVTYSLSGEDIPALSRTIPFPARLTTTTPGVVAGDNLRVPAKRATGLTLEWEGGAAGVLYQVSGDIGDGAALLYCEWDSTLGQGTISPSLLSRVSSGTLVSTVTASAWRDTINGYDVSFALGAETYDSDGHRVYLEVQ